uniref:Uncharacterized protein n=1 Tax=Arundo donax TaxID=35708 RepID=A0A0A8Z2M0_ARUDO
MTPPPTPAPARVAAADAARTKPPSSQAVVRLRTVRPCEPNHITAQPCTPMPR